MKNKLFILFVTLFLSVIAKAQTISTEPNMADTFRSEGKIYVVIAVIAITFICLIGYLVYIDIKLKRLEKKD